MLSILIPERNEDLLTKTIIDVLDNATGDFEIIVNVDEKRPEELIVDPRVEYIFQPRPIGMRAGIRVCADIAQGEYLMKLDAHCRLMPGFDEAIVKDIEPDWIVIPRRVRLDHEAWKVLEPTPEKPPVDYEHLLFPLKYKPPELHGFRWTSRAAERLDILIDDTMTFQGSCWVMSHYHFDRHQFFTDPGYQGIPKQEAEELALTTWTTGGSVKVNKSVWYAHMHKVKTAGYDRNRQQVDDCYAYSYQHWVFDNRAGFKALIEKFWPVEGWPNNWEDKIYGAGK